MSPCFRSYSNGKFCQLQSNRIVQRNLRQVLIVEICQTQEIRPCAAQPTSTLSQCSCRGATRTNFLNPGVQPLPQPRGWRLIAWPFCHEPLGIEGLQQCQPSAKKRAAQPRGAPLASRAGSSRSTQRRAWPAECKTSFQTHSQPREGLAHEGSDCRADCRAGRHRLNLCICRYL